MIVIFIFFPDLQPQGTEVMPDLKLLDRVVNLSAMSGVIYFFNCVIYFYYITQLYIFCDIFFST